MAALEKIPVLNPLTLRNTVGGELADIFEARGIKNFEELIGIKNLRSKEVKKEEVNNSLNTCAEQVVIRLPLTGKNEHPVTQELVDQFAELYPAVDIMQELRNMKGWLINNPERRKTKSGINRFINRWLAKAQNQSRGDQQPVPQKKGSTNPFLEMLERGEFDE